MGFSNLISAIQAEAKKAKPQDALEEFKFYDVDRNYKQALLDSLNQDKDERKKYAKWIFWFTCTWSGLMFTILILSGFDMLNFSSTIIVTLIGTTTANAFGFFYLVTKYLFNTNNKIAKHWLKSLITNKENEGYL